MNKEEFLLELEECLHGEVEEAIIQDSVSYYRDYIGEQMRNGKEEQQILEELGDANFIARTIIDANERNFEYQGEEEVISEGHQDPYREMEEEERKENIQKTTSNIVRWGVILIGIVVILGIVGFLFKAFLPIIIIIVAIGFIKKLFEDRY